MTVEKIAEEFQVTSQTIGNWIKAGALQALRVGHVYRVRREELEAMTARQRMPGSSWNFEAIHLCDV